ncbi:MAG: hypothetical protein ABL878_15040 [Burkholderiales bacterium]
MTAISVAIAYKIFSIPVSLDLKFADLLSLLLALFAIGLSALFYFKATDTSNAFYDNTYKYTKDIAELLTRIEAGFGERLRHIDEGYTSMRNRLSEVPTGTEIPQAKREVKQEEQAITKILAERDEVIEEFARAAKVREEERQQFLANLKAKETDLSAAREELSAMHAKLASLTEQPVHSDTYPLRAVTRYLRDSVLDQMEIMEIAPPELDERIIQSSFRDIAKKLPRSFLRDMELVGFVGRAGYLTKRGILRIKSLHGSRWESDSASEDPSSGQAPPT